MLRNVVSPLVIAVFLFVTGDSSDQQVGVGDSQQALPQLDLRGVLMALARDDYPLLELEVLHQVPHTHTHTHTLSNGANGLTATAI